MALARTLRWLAAADEGRLGIAGQIAYVVEIFGALGGAPARCSRPGRR